MVPLKGQTDIIGVVIIVLLLVIIALFSLRFLLPKQEPLEQKLSIKANNVLNAALKTSICQSTVEQGLINCCRKDPFCGKDACSYISKELQKLFDASLEEPYLFHISQNEQDCLHIGKCTEGVSSSSYILGQPSEQYKVGILLCKK